MLKKNLSLITIILFFNLYPIEQPSAIESRRLPLAHPISRPATSATPGFLGIPQNNKKSLREYLSNHSFLLASIAYQGLFFYENDVCEYAINNKVHFGASCLFTLYQFLKNDAYYEDADIGMSLFLLPSKSSVAAHVPFLLYSIKNFYDKLCRL